jgi:hypothetical protein
VTGGWRKVHNEVHDLSTLLNIVRMTKWYISGRRETTKGRNRLKVNVKCITNRVQGVKWVQLAPIGTSGMVSTVAKLRFPQHAVKFFTICFSRGILLDAVSDHCMAIRK